MERFIYFLLEILLFWLIQILILCSTMCSKSNIFGDPMSLLYAPTKRNKEKLGHDFHYGAQHCWQNNLLFIPFIHILTE